MPLHHLSRPSTGLVVLNADGGLPGQSGPSFQKPEQPAGPSFQKPEGAIYQPPPAQGLPGAPVPQGGTYELSGWWRRVGATLLDGLILAVPFIPIFFIVVAIFGISIGTSDDDTSGAGIVASILLFFLLIAVYSVIALIYAPYFMARWNGATPGKRALGIRVVRADGLPMTFGAAAVREVAVKNILFGFIIGSFTAGLGSLLNLLWPLWDSENRALHDMIVNTRVVRG